MIAPLKMAGVAGFEPTNDGVRGSMGEGNLAIFAPEKLSKKCHFGQENKQKPIKNHYFLRFFLLPKNRL